MDINRAIGLLRKALDEIAHLRTLDLGNKEFDQWYYKVLDILEVTFSKNSSEYERFSRAVSVYLPTYTKADRDKEYNRRLDEYETALKSIIQKYEMLEEEKLVAKVKPTKVPKDQEDRQEKEPLGKEIRKHLKGTPWELAPHIARVAQEFKFRGLKYWALEELKKSSQVSKQLRIICGSYFGPMIYFIGGEDDEEEETPRDSAQDIGIITLQSLPDNKALFIARQIPSSFDINGSYFDSFLERLSLEFRNLGFEQKLRQKIWQWIKSHKVLSIIFAAIILGVTLLGTNWTLVEENFAKFLEIFR